MPEEKADRTLRLNDPIRGQDNATKGRQTFGAMPGHHGTATGTFVMVYGNGILSYRSGDRITADDRQRVALEAANAPIGWKHT